MNTVKITKRGQIMRGHIHADDKKELLYEKQATKKLKEGLSAQKINFNCLLNLIYQNHANPNTLDNYGRKSILHRLVVINDDHSFDNDLRKLVNEYGANINLRDDYNYTVLQYFINANRFSAATALLLVELGADANTEDAQGNSLLALLIKQNKQGENNPIIKELMEKHGAKENYALSAKAQYAAYLTTKAANDKKLFPCPETNKHTFAFDVVMCRRPLQIEHLTQPTNTVDQKHQQLSIFPEHKPKNKDIAPEVALYLSPQPVKSQREQDKAVPVEESTTNKAKPVQPIEQNRVPFNISKLLLNKAGTKKTTSTRNGNVKKNFAVYTAKK
jgi:hypothetical protein